MQVELNAQGFSVGRYKVHSLMQALQLKAKGPKQYHYPHTGKPDAVAPNSLNRQFNPSFTNTPDMRYYLHTHVAGLVIFSHCIGFVFKTRCELGI